VGQLAFRLALGLALPKQRAKSVGAAEKFFDGEIGLGRRDLVVYLQRSGRDSNRHSESVSDEVNAVNRFLIVLFLFAVTTIPIFGGTVQQLPALPNGATAGALQVDSAGNIYVAGSVPPKKPKSSADSTDAFIAKLSPDGSKLIYFTALGGSNIDAAVALALGSNDSVYVTGTSYSSDFPVTEGALQTVYGGTGGQAFAAKLSPNGATIYATYIGGTAETTGAGVAVDG